MNGIQVAFVDYTCRVCGSAAEVGVSPRMIDGDFMLCPCNHRITVTECSNCGQERPHVLDHPEADAAHEQLPIKEIKS